LPALQQPVAADGAGLLKGEDYVVVALRASPTAPARARVYDGLTFALQNDVEFSGDPVALDATTVYATSWVLTRNPSSVTMFETHNGNAPAHEVLDLSSWGTPLAMTVEAYPDCPGSCPGLCKFKCDNDDLGFQSAMVHVVVKK
jgi:hypothetical protein